jgi:hypothetical protein
LRPVKSVGVSATPASTALAVSSMGWLLVGPRVELLGVGGASLRLEDFVLLSLGIFALTHWRTIRAHRLIHPGIGFILIVSLICVGVAVSRGSVAVLPAVLYAVRPLEYWVIYPALALVMWRDRDRAVRYVVACLALVTILNTGVAALQYLGNVAIGFSKFSNQRGAGLTAGPYELGAISAMLACFWFARRRYLLVVLSLASVLMSQSRVSLVATVVALIVIRVAGRERFSQDGDDGRMPARPTGPHPLSVLLCMAVVVIAVFTGPTLNSALIQPAIERAQSTSVVSSWTSAASVVARTSHLATSAEYASVAYDGIGESILNATASSDASSAVRFFRWQLLLRETLGDPLHVIFGLGPSFPGPSVDGALLRVFVETGLLGALAWMLLIRKWLWSSPIWFSAAVLSLLIGSIFIDLLFALRPMVVLWMLFALVGRDVGVVQVRRHKTPTSKPALRLEDPGSEAKP